MARWSLRALLASGVALTLLLVWFAVAMPDRVPGHFGLSGEVNRYDDKGVFVAAMAGIGVVMAVLFGAARWWLPTLPGSVINVPGKKAHAYWTSPAHRDEFNAIMASAMETIGAFVLLLLTVIVLISGVAGLGATIPAWIFWLVTATFLAAMMACVIPLMRKTRVPPSER
ncbi:DUF1648 domain-containing protein [Smaragdicoccus niigatensis]|uniref:DUF1648 domain-containing protein n=1 Tax=Smaragdicoccus niigatensis TaxID=359359 RepID=UPI0003691116|nr:DUF1648 domain-containing protein [Smaragdicoccus niigatensis]